jgi:uncharacterized Zn finger protein
MDDWRGWRNFPRSPLRAAKGGIRAQSQRGNFGQNWWAKRWLAVLESFQLGGRLHRGRAYARRGQVISISIERGGVSAEVQGSRPTPYEVELRVNPLSEGDWRKVAEVVSGQAIFGAKLLGGEMPQDIETVFQAAGLSLFPQNHSDLKTGCSCPDWSNPCKHIAAVYYLLGEEFDRDPFLIFRLRGIEREAFLALLGERAPAVSAGPPEEEALPVSAHSFWSGGVVPDVLIGETGPPAGAALPRRAGKFPFWRGRQNFLDTMESIYKAAAVKTAETIMKSDNSDAVLK